MDFLIDDASLDRLITMADDPAALAEVTKIVAERLHPGQISTLIERLEQRRDEVAMGYRMLGAIADSVGSGEACL
ncbi:hypothetical protein [Streptomyces sp. NPDC001404]|uniref:hypothetical protein n=1 Tax=Streptomyces sp. NPDC001404 TaxID=3364571 RepID=UPI0036BB49FC